MKFFEGVIRHKIVVIIVFACAALVSVFLMLGVGQNYDMSKYLPEGSNSKKGIDALTEEYAYNGSASLLLEDVSVVEALAVKEQIMAIAGVETVVWLDDLADMTQPVDFIDEEIRNNYYAGDDALFQIVFTENDYAQGTHEAVSQIKAQLGEDALLSGGAVDAYINVNSINGNILTGIVIALAIVLAILFLTTDSLFEVVLFLIGIGVAIVINMGTNIIFGEVSYMTFASAAILQLAISMDYSIFLLHRFGYERQTESDPAKAMARAARASLSSILSSGMTTVVGFIALVFMSYTIGLDMGLVLAKGIVFSLLSVLVLLPALSVLFVKTIDRTKHRRLLPSLKNVQHKLGGKARYAILAVLALLSVIGFLAQNNNTFMYSVSNVGDSSQELANTKMEESFGKRNDIIVLVARGDAVREYGMVEKLEELGCVRGVQGLYAFVDQAFPEQVIPDAVKSEFLSEHYSRYVVTVDTAVEGDDATAAVSAVRGVVDASYEDAYVTGASPVITDMRDATAGDFSLVTILSIVFVGIILLLTFRSISIPVILLFIIETSIWINMSFPYFSGEPMIFIGYMIISAVQLGATIDYAILMTNYYLEGRATMPKREAAEYATEKAGASILVSALVLSAAGFVVASVFTQEAMAQLGTLIGRGALLSGALTIFVLPQVLTLLDNVIQKTTMRRKFREEIHEDQQSRAILAEVNDVDTAARAKRGRQVSKKRGAL